MKTKDAKTLTGIVIAVCRSATHTMSKPKVLKIRVLEGLGVEGDAHQGVSPRTQLA
jgi:hypothetical protein